MPYDNRNETVGTTNKSIEAMPSAVVRPKMCASGNIDELFRDTNSVSCFANAPFQHIAHPKLSPDLLYF
jgi:hypothetical protein